MHGYSGPMRLKSQKILNANSIMVHDPRSTQTRITKMERRAAMWSNCPTCWAFSMWTKTTIGYMENIKNDKTGVAKTKRTKYKPCICKRSIGHKWFGTATTMTWLCQQYTWDFNYILGLKFLLDVHLHGLLHGHSKKAQIGQIGGSYSGWRRIQLLLQSSPMYILCYFNGDHIC